MFFPLCKEYLARKGYVHRDLAARNVLIGGLLVFAVLSVFPTLPGCKIPLKVSANINPYDAEE